jgi:16S rRNA (cytosine1402-N4)-methyltransferase
MVAVVGLDQDPDALAAAALALEAFGDRVTLRRARFDSLGIVMTELGIPSLSGALFDLGVSSPQLDRGEHRG